MLTSLDPLEIHSGIVLGARRSPLPPAPRVIPGAPRRVLDELLAGALSKSPCFVLFSGGRDSSVILAAATQTARKHGLPEPIPLTARFAAHPRTWETAWQERTVRQLGLTEWTRFDVHDELDALGELATGALLRHGPYWPPNAHTILLFARHVGSGSMLTGGGGDELLERWEWGRMPLRQVARLSPRRNILKWGPYNCLPLALRRRLPDNPTAIWTRWLTEDALAQLRHRQLAARGDPPRAWADSVEHYLRGRYLECVRATLDTLAAATGACLIEPFYDVRLIRSVVAQAPARGYASRTAALETLFGDLLSTEVLRRGTKAEFGSAIWGPAARSFATDWDGRGVDVQLAEPARVRAEWLRERPDGRAIAMIQSAWYEQQPQARASASSR